MENTYRDDNEKYLKNRIEAFQNRIAFLEARLEVSELKEELNINLNR